jgi:aryl-alcohol dehydrogenase-like predicted oxidoreductase
LVSAASHGLLSAAAVCLVFCPVSLSRTDTAVLCRPYSAEKSTDRSKELSFGGEPSAATQAIIAKIQEIAKKRGIPMSHVAFAWSTSKPFVTAPIIGTTKIEQLRDAIEAVSVELTKDEVEEIDKLYEPTKVFGHA